MVGSVFALVFDQDDTYEAVLQLFARREDAELVAEGLLGKPIEQYATWRVWSEHDGLEVQEWMLP